MPELTLKEEVDLGRAAEAALKSDSLFTRVLTRLEESYRLDARTTPAGLAGRDLREALHAKMCALDDIRAALRTMEGNGEIAAAQIAEEERRSKK